MGLHKNFPLSPYEILDPEINGFRWIKICWIKVMGINEISI